MRILYVEDEKQLSDAVGARLRREKYEVEIVHDGSLGLEYGLTGIYDLIILDVLLPKKNGMEVMRELRKAKISTPILMLTALSQEADKVAGLDSGADDYLSKPFSMEELLARIRALLRRRGNDFADSNSVTYLDLCLDTATYALTSGDKKVRLSPKEFELAKCLISNHNLVMTKEVLISKIWGLDSEIESNTLEAFISFLRKKIAFVGAKVAIVSVRGVGYVMEEL